jgi:hypothetical protein
MQMVEMRVRNQHQVDRRKIGNAQSGTAKTFQNEQPPRKVGINDDILSTDLDEEAGVPNEGDAELAVAGETRLVGLSRARSDRRVAHQSTELSGALAKGRIAKSLFNHPANRA